MPAYPSPVATWRTCSYAAISASLPHLSTTGKNIVITGAGSGIGAAIAHSFAASGASTISLLGRRESALSSTKSSLFEKFPDTKVFKYATDLTSAQSVYQAFADIRSSIGNIDILVANAGYSPPLKTIANSTIEEWSTSFDINVIGNVNLVKAFLPLAAKNASVLHITAGAAHVPHLPGFGAGSTSKLAGAKVFEYLHYENPDLFIVNIHPGLIDTGISGNPNKYNFDDSRYDVFTQSLVADVTPLVSLPADFAVVSLFFLHSPP